MSRVQLKDGYCGKQKVLVFAEETRWQLSDLMVQERQRLLKNCAWESWYFIIAICQNRLFQPKIDTLELDKSILENVQSSSQQNETLIRTILARMHFLEMMFINQ